MAQKEENMLRLHTLLGDYANTQGLKSGAVASARLVFDFDDVKLPQTAFKKVVRGEYDVAELAIVTYLQALAPRQAGSAATDRGDGLPVAPLSGLQQFARRSAAFRARR